MKNVLFLASKPSDGGCRLTFLSNFRPHNSCVYNHWTFVRMYDSNSSIDLTDFLQDRAKASHERSVYEKIS